jgi:hypothetical protein
MGGTSAWVYAIPADEGNDLSAFILNQLSPLIGGKLQFAMFHNLLCNHDWVGGSECFLQLLD